MHKKLIVLALIVLAVIVTLEWSKKSGSSLLGGSTYSPYILELTSPVYSVSGTIEKVSENEITVVKELVTVVATTNTLPAALPAGQTLPTTEPTKPPAKLTYVVTIGKNTPITKSSVGAVSANPENSPKATIKIGDLVTVYSSEDLRVVKNNSFTAGSISIETKNYTLNGKVSRVEQNKLEVFGMATMINTIGIANNSQKEKNYEILVDKDTQIVQTNPDPAKSSSETKLSLSNLKKDSLVTLTMTEEGGVFKATRISPVATDTVSATIPGLPSGSTASQSAQPATSPAPSVAVSPAVSPQVSPAQ